VTAALLVEALRARGIQLRVVGDRLRYRPAAALTTDDLEALRQHKAEVLELLSAPPLLRILSPLDPVTVREVLGAHADQHDLGILRLDVLASIRKLEAEIATGSITPRVRLVRGRPLADWLSLDDIARLMRPAKGRR
jgi:hypothetical protein